MTMTERSSEVAPQVYARICGGLYLYIIVAGLFAEMFVRSKLVVAGNAAATASNIMANERLFRIGLSGELLHLAADVGVAALLYGLLRPVDRTVAVLATLMRLAAAIILAVASISHFVALRLLAGAAYLNAFPADQRQSLALLALRLHGDGYAICLVFFGFACLALGYLIFRSGYLPRSIGVLMAIAGACYLFNSFVRFLAPTAASVIFQVILLPVFVAELSLAVWLVVKGVDAARWQARASSSAR